VPIYDYHCDRCGHAFSAVRSYTDKTVGPACPKCGATPRRLITAPAIVFKGSGWYKTDSRGSSPATAKDDASKAGASKDAAPKDAPAKTEAAKPDAATGDSATSSAKRPPAGEAAS